MHGQLAVSVPWGGDTEEGKKGQKGKDEIKESLTVRAQDG